jgi:hypothetical protein
MDPANGDIKDLWEPARFAWAYDLIRGHLVAPESASDVAFWNAVRNFKDGNPTFLGSHWSCGQETAIRATALLFAEANLPADQDQGREVAALLAASAERIDDAIGYAVSQRNNHAISEATGLLLLGRRFLNVGGRHLKDAHPMAVRWMEKGRRILERAVPDQFGGDGWYAQHSFTYLRVALDQLALSELALRSVHLGLSQVVKARIRAAFELLLSVVDPGTGQVPNHGPNDGAFVLPITLAPYRDFRPCLTVTAATFGFPLPSDIAVDHEALAWLSLESPERGPALENPRLAAGSSGWAGTTVGPAFAFLRAGAYRSRPGHMDPLHVDVRFGAEEVIVDPGTFAYSAPPPWNNPLSAARYHNGPLLDDEEPGIRGPRFLWYKWPRAELINAQLIDGTAVLQALVPGRVRRTVRVAGDGVRIEDEVLVDAGEATIRFLLHPNANPRQVEVEGGFEVHEAVEGDPLGWFSPTYGERIPSRAIVIRRPAKRGLVIKTHVRPSGDLS